MEKLIKNTISHESFFMVNKAMLRYLESANAAIILSGLISKHDYFKKRNQVIDGYFYNTKEMIMQETGMSEATILRAEKTLELKGLIHTKLKGLPRVKYYAMQWEHIERVLHNEYSATNKTQVALPVILSIRNEQDDSGNNNELTILKNDNRENDNRETKERWKMVNGRRIYDKNYINEELS